MHNTEANKQTETSSETRHLNRGGQPVLQLVSFVGFSHGEVCQREREGPCGSKVRAWRAKSYKRG